jgi:XRE family transcriptional regulator, aerobic/anaerobic benzoate catabolism transcriptional regulator
MSSTILHINPEVEAEEEAKNPLLVTLGERVRTQRARRGMTRKALAAAANVSERHLANLEYGVGNASVLVLSQVADALECPLAQLLGDMTTANPEWLMLRELLAPCDEVQLKHLRLKPHKESLWWAYEVLANPRWARCSPRSWAIRFLR